jgi:hypothetical protein
VDDGGIFSDEATIQEVKYLGKLENFIKCMLMENKEKDTIWIHHPKLFKHLEQKFGHLLQDVREYKTPVAQKTTIV